MDHAIPSGYYATFGVAMGYAVILAIAFGIVWACVVSRGFRIAVAILILVGMGWLMMKSDEAEKQKTIDQAASKARDLKFKARQSELWSKVSPSEIELRSPVLIPQKFSSDYDLRASIKNLSRQQLGAFEIEVTALDCVAREKCEVIGHTSEVFWADIPPQQVRGVTGKITLSNMPQLRGNLSSTFVVKRVYAGDILDQWDVGDQK